MNVPRSGAALRVAIAAAVLASVGWAEAAPDYAREERWAQEVVPAIMVGDPVWLKTPARDKVLALEADPRKPRDVAVVLVHGLGVNPDFGMIGALRGTLAEAGYVTLSVQMPVLAADAPREDYAATFPEAGERIAAAARHLRDKGIAKVVLVSHSMGASMANAYLARSEASGFAGWVPVGMMVPFDSRPRMPVLDVMAADDFPQVKETAGARKKALPGDACSAQVTIAGNDHYFERGDAALAAAIGKFLERIAADRC